jgi:hypothetical protein
MLAVEKIRCGKHYPSRLLQDQVGEASSIPVPHLREDLLVRLIIDSNFAAPPLMKSQF